MTDELLQELGRLLPEGTDAPLIAFSVQAHSRLRSELQVLNPEVGYFLHTATGVVQHQQECPIAEGEAALSRQPMKERRNLVSVEKAGFRWWDAFAGNGRNLLRDCKTLGHSPTQKLKKRMQDHQPVVACPPMIVACVFEMLEEPQDAVERERLEGDLRKPTGHIGGNEADKKPQSIPMSLDGGCSKALSQGELVGKECVEQGGKRGRTHGVTWWMSGFAQFSNR